MKRSYAGKEGHPPGLVNFSEGLYEKKTLIPLLELGAHACSDCQQQSSTMLKFGCLALIELTGRSEPKLFIWRKVDRLVTLTTKQGDPTRGANFLFLM